MTTEDLTEAEKKYRDKFSDEEGERKAITPAAMRLGRPVPELYFATVRAIGTPLTPTIVQPLTRALETVGFSLEVLKLSEQLERLTVEHGLPDGDTTGMSPYDRYASLTRSGAQWRQLSDRQDALAVEAVKWTPGRVFPKDVEPR